MRRFRLIWILMVVSLLSACGYNPEKPVYNTADNPKGFPAMAVVLLDDMENGQIAGLDSVSNSFADLYLTHPELLDNQDWQDVVDRLGARFLFLAERLRSSDEFGINDYTRLADYYTLAAFAHPGDTGLLNLSEAFACWRDVVDKFPRLENSVGRSTMVLGDKLAVTRMLAYGGPTCRAFLRNYLLTPLWGSTSDLTNAESADQALLQFAGAPVEFEYSPLVAFADPRIDLATMKITPLDSGRHDVQLFFVAHDSLSEDYSIAFWVNTGKSGDVIGESRIPFDFEPLEPSSRWIPGRAAAAHQTVEYAGKINRVSVGLYKSFGARLEFVPLQGTDSNLIRIDVE